MTLTSESGIIKVQLTPFYIAKIDQEHDETELLINYMKKHGWSFYSQMGCGYFFKKEDKIKEIQCTEVKTVNNLWN